MKSFVDISVYWISNGVVGYSFVYAGCFLSVNVEWQEENMCFVPGGEST